MISPCHSHCILLTWETLSPHPLILAVMKTNAPFIKADTICLQTRQSSCYKTEIERASERQLSSEIVTFQMKDHKQSNYL